MSEKVKEIQHEHQTEIVYSNKHKSYYESKEYVDYRKEWDTRLGNRQHKDFPVNLDVSVTNHCNIKCVMCTRTITALTWSYGTLVNTLIQSFNI